jgi:transposase
MNSKNCTDDGEIAEHSIYEINETLIQDEMQYDGFYAVCTNLEADASQIVSINKGRWEIEESFRIMKSEFKSRPVFLSRDDRIEAHFITCFLALLVYRLLEKTLNNELSNFIHEVQVDQYTCSNIIQTLKDMNFYKINHEGFIPTYERTPLTDSLHKAFGLRTDYEIIPDRVMKKY